MTSDEEGQGGQTKLEFSVEQQGAITLSSKLLDSAHIAVQYHCLPDSQPKKAGSRVSVWLADQSPWNQEPLATEAIENDTPDGDLIVTIPDAKSSRPPYLVMFATDQSPGSLCASQVVPAQGDPSPPIATSVTAGWVGTDSIWVKFSTLGGNNPAANNNWISLWVGQSATYSDRNRVAKCPVSSSNAIDSQAMNQLALLFDTYYTLGYSVGPRPEDLAAWMTFKTQEWRPLHRLILRVGLFCLQLIPPSRRRPPRS